MKPPSARTLHQLENAARRAAAGAYAPYSDFRVGAAVLAGSKRIYPGCNVENASYGLCNCAERTAIFAAVAAGERTIEAVAIYTPTATAIAPCGACRQVINEFGPEAIVISVCDTAERLETNLARLLPDAFGPAQLQGTNAAPASCAAPAMPRPSARGRKSRAAGA